MVDKSKHKERANFATNGHGDSGKSGTISKANKGNIPSNSKLPTSKTAAPSNTVKLAPDKKENKDKNRKPSNAKPTESGRKISTSKPVDAKKIKPTPNINKKKKSVMMRIFASFGYSSHDIVVTNKPALEAIRALNLQQKHLLRLKRAFDAIDVDGSGSIDATEFLVRKV